MAGKLELPFGVKVVDGKPLIFYYDNEGTPWGSVELAEAGIPLGFRHLGMTVLIGTAEYWWQTSTADGSLIVKTASGSDAYFFHEQLSASATWVIPHLLGKNPSIVVHDSAGTEVYGDVTYDTANQVTIVFTGSFSGEAYLN